MDIEQVQDYSGIVTHVNKIQNGTKCKRRYCYQKIEMLSLDQKYFLKTYFLRLFNKNIRNCMKVNDLVVFRDGKIYDVRENSILLQSLSRSHILIGDNEIVNVKGQQFLDELKHMQLLNQQHQQQRYNKVPQQHQVQQQQQVHQQNQVYEQSQVQQQNQFYQQSQVQSLNQVYQQSQVQSLNQIEQQNQVLYQNQALQQNQVLQQTQVLEQNQVLQQNQLLQQNQVFYQNQQFNIIQKSNDFNGIICKKGNIKTKKVNGQIMEFKKIEFMNFDQNGKFQVYKIRLNGVRAHEQIRIGQRILIKNSNIRRLKGDYISLINKCGQYATQIFIGNEKIKQNSEKEEYKNFMSQMDKNVDKMNFMQNRLKNLGVTKNIKKTS